MPVDGIWPHMPENLPEIQSLTTVGNDRVGVETFLQILDDGFIDYGEVGGWAAGGGDVLDSLAGVTAAGHAAQALQLAEYAIDRIEAAMEAIDDSNGD